MLAHITKGTPSDPPTLNALQVVAVDVVQEAVQAVREAAAAAGVQDRCVALQMDVFDLPTNFSFQTAVTLAGAASASGPISNAAAGEAAAAVAASPGNISMIYDSQTFHVLRQVDEQRLVKLLYSLLQPGGLLLILAGNANEGNYVAGKGPPVLTQQELLGGLQEHGFEVVGLLQTRFDETQHYREVIGKCPLAWWALLRKPASAPAGATAGVTAAAGGGGGGGGDGDMHGE